MFSDLSCSAVHERPAIQALGEPDDGCPYPLDSVRHGQGPAIPSSKYSTRGGLNRVGQASAAPILLPGDEADLVLELLQSELDGREPIRPDPADAARSW